jgi:hypothetical protein
VSRQSQGKADVTYPLKGLTVSHFGGPLRPVPRSRSSKIRPEFLVMWLDAVMPLSVYLASYEAATSISTVMPC